MKSIKNWLKTHTREVALFFLLFVGFVVRIYLVDKVVVGDLMNYAEWGEHLVNRGAYNLYFTKDWYYSVPVYPPLSILTFAGSYWLNEHRYVLAELHNIIKFPPAFFIIYFYKWGYIFLLKFLPIICDLLISVVILRLSLKLGSGFKRAFAVSAFYLLNPITIFISGAWGQTDSIVALLGILSFLSLVDRKYHISIPLMFLGLYFKPSWAILGIFYSFILLKSKPDWKKVILGLFVTVIIFVISTKPFSDGNVFAYGWKLFRERYPLPIGIDGKASISAFNFQTIFFKLDIDYSHEKLIGITSGNLGLISYIILNLVSFNIYNKSGNKLFGMLAGIFTIGFGSFLFMATMLERYFFPAFIPLFVLLAVKPKLVWNSVVINVILALNILYSFYRRGSDEIGRPFVNNNFLVIRILSVVQTLAFLNFVKKISTGRS